MPDMAGMARSCLAWIWPLLLLILWVVPNVLVTMLFTDMIPPDSTQESFGMEMIKLLANHKQSANNYAIICAGAAVLIMSVLYVCGWPTWAEEYDDSNDTNNDIKTGIVKTRLTGLQLFTGTFPWLLLLVASFLKSFEYPIVVRMLVWAHAPIFVMLLKVWCVRINVPPLKVWCMKDETFESQFMTCVHCVVTLTYSILALISGWWYCWQDKKWDQFSEQLTNNNSGEHYHEIYSQVYKSIHDNISSVVCGNISDHVHVWEDKPEEFKKIPTACATAEGVFFALWATPFLYIMILVIRIFFHIAQFYFYWHRTGPKEHEFVMPCPLLAAKFLACVLTVCIGALIIVPATGAHVNVINGIAPAGFLFAVLVLIWALWNYSRVRRELNAWEERKNPQPQEGASDGMSRVLDQLVILKRNFDKIQQMMANEWIQAMLMGSIMPVFYLLESLRRRVTPGPSEGTRNSAFIAVTDQFMMHLGAISPDQGVLQPGIEKCKKWNICSVLVKVCLLGELYFTLQVGGTKATYVVLSAVQEQLKSYDFEVILALAFGVGFLMFMLPFVPGVPVYIFCGMVVTTAWTERAQDGDPQTQFYLGCAISVCLGLCLKLLACTGQYLIGLSASRSIAVLKYVGADTKVTRAIAVAVGGADASCFGKVLVMVGGPDWPTSVMCGILKVSVPSMLCHTIPVVTVMSPCVLAGAYLASVSCNGQGSAAVSASFYSVLAAAGQLGSMLGAMLYLQHIYTTKLPDAPGEGEPIYNDYKKVVTLRGEEKKAEEVYEQVLNDTSFCQDRGRPAMGLAIGMAAFLTVVSNAVFTTDLAFENFSVSSSINDHLDKCGLNGDPWNIVRGPGKVALGLFAASVLLHITFVAVKSAEAKKRARSATGGTGGEGGHGAGGQGGEDVCRPSDDEKQPLLNCRC